MPKHIICTVGQDPHVLSFGREWTRCACGFTVARFATPPEGISVGTPDDRLEVIVAASNPWAVRVLAGDPVAPQLVHVGERNTRWATDEEAADAFGEAKVEKCA